MRAGMLYVSVAVLVSLSASTAGLAASCSGVASQLQLASKDLARNRVSAAAALLASLEVLSSRCPDVLLVRARIDAAQGEVNGAQTAFRRYIQLQPDDSRGYAYFARFLIDQEQYQQADDLSAIAMQKNAQDPAALAVRGQILDMKGQSQQGLELLEKSCRINPENADAQFQAGAIDDRAKLHANAVRHFEKVVALDPANPSAWDYLALNLEPLGKIEAAETAYKKGSAANQDAQNGPNFDAFLDYNYGVFLEKRNQLADSMLHLNRAVKLVPQMRDPWYERAKVNLQMHNYGSARADAEKAASLPERTGGVINLQVYALLEQIYRRLGETTLADKYAALSRATPPPIRKEYGQQMPQ